MTNTFAYTLICIAAVMFLAPARGAAQDFVYTPTNPAFGGSPVNYSWLLSSANAQNLYKATPDFGFDRDPLASFRRSLQRQILRELTDNILQERLGNVDLSEGGTYSFGTFSIQVVPGPNGINIIIQNLATGEQTTITIPNF